MRPIRVTMNSTSGQLKVDGKVDQAFEVLQGLKERDGLALIIFNLTLESVVRESNIITSALNNRFSTNI